MPASRRLYLKMRTERPIKVKADAMVAPAMIPGLLCLSETVFIAVADAIGGDVGVGLVVDVLAVAASVVMDELLVLDVPDEDPETEVEDEAGAVDVAMGIRVEKIGFARLTIQISPTHK